MHPTLLATIQFNFLVRPSLACSLLVNKDTLLNLLSNIQNDLISTIGIGGIAIDLAITHFPTTV